MTSPVRHDPHRERWCTPGCRGWWRESDQARLAIYHLRRDIEKEFDLFYNPVATIAKEEVVSVSKEELEIGFYHGDGLLLEEVIKEQVLLDLPMKGICREDCSGLCPSCGQNLNLAACGCKASLGDPSWAPLAK